MFRLKTARHIHNLQIVAFFSLAIAVFGGCSSSDYKESERSGRFKHDFLYWTGLGNYQKLEAAADVFLEGTNECILDVRDRGITYEKSANCALLEKLADAYLSAGGDAPRGEEPSVIYARGQEAIKYMWMARAVSALGGGHHTLWVW